MRSEGKKSQRLLARAEQQDLEEQHRELGQSCEAKVGVWKLYKGMKMKHALEISVTVVDPLLLDSGLLRQRGYSSLWAQDPGHNVEQTGAQR